MAIARQEEVEHATEEGASLVILAAPVEFLGDEEGRLVGMRLQQMEPGPPDQIGRPRPEPIEGSESTIDLDVAVVAVGNTPNSLLPKTGELAGHVDRRRRDRPYYQTWCLRRR